MRSYLVQNILWNSTHKPLLIHTKASIDSMGKVASCPSSELDIIHTLLEFRQTREFVTLDREPSQQALRWSCRKVQLSAVCFSRCLCVQIVFSTMWWVPASSLTPICVCVCVCTEGWITLLTVPGTRRTRPREPSPSQEEAALVLVCGNWEVCVPVALHAEGCWDIIDFCGGGCQVNYNSQMITRNIII